MEAQSAEKAIPSATPRALEWLDQYWPFAGTVAMAFLIALLPLLMGVWPLTLVLVYLLLIVYQLHQIEEHFGDRFRRFVNPGLWTALALFIPIGGWAWTKVHAANGLGSVAHMIGLAAAVLGHAAIIGNVRRRLWLLK